jgi:hypothetical protein
MDNFYAQKRSTPRRPKTYPNDIYDPNLYLTENGRYTFKFKLVDDKTYLTRLPDPDHFPDAPFRIYYHIRAWDSKNREIYNTYGNRAPLYSSLGTGEMIKCLDESIPFIAFGRKARVECAADMCYGSEGVPGIVPPNEPLKFEIEVMGLNKQYLQERDD